VFDPARQVKRVEGGNVFGPLPAELVTS
jgi:hypothetical protein